MTMAPVPAPRTRPGGVTFACVLSMVLGGFGAMGGLMLMALGAALAGVFPFFGALAGAMIGTVGVFAIVMGILGLVAGAQGLRGQGWARWTMVVLFALGALATVGGFAAVLPLAVTALDVAAVVMLLNEDAKRYFESA